MSELAAFMVDEVFPHVPVRQVVLSFPFPVRFWLAKNPHVHMLWVDGLYHVKEEKPVFHEVPAPSDEEIGSLVETLSTRILKTLKRKGYPVDDEGDSSEDEAETFLDVQSASVQSVIALGERRGQKVRRLGLAMDLGNFEGAVIEGERCASHRGFSLHANVSCEAHERDKLEHMVRYIARPPVAMERLRQRGDGLIRAE